MDFFFILIVISFLLGYVGIILEFWIRINKTAISLMLSGICWVLYFLGGSHSMADKLSYLSGHLSDVSQILFFLLGAMTLVEIIDSHKGFRLIVSIIRTQNKRQLFLFVSFVSFFLSAVLDNLTTTILMISILRKIIPDSHDRVLPNCMVVVAANAGGIWTPIGDVTTTMLWIDHRISTFRVIQALFFPSLISMIIPLLYFLPKLRGKYVSKDVAHGKEAFEPYGNFVFICGMGALMSVPLIKWLTGMPPFMGMIIALSALWLLTDIIHSREESRSHLRVSFILKKVDVSTVLFFLGILLAIDALEAIGILRSITSGLYQITNSPLLIATIIGILSACVDNVPLVAASIRMYNVDMYPMDAPFWLFIAFTSGFGGSLLSIGSSAGVALMGLEKVSFLRYFQVTFLAAFLGYCAGILCCALFV